MGRSDESLDARVAQLERLLAAITAERDLQARRADALSRELVRSETALAELESLRVALAASEARADFADECREQLERVERELEAMRSTLSWRSTQPLRVVRRRFPNGPN
jgi:hypothetical protein